MNRNYIKKLKFYIGNTKGELDVPLVKKQEPKPMIRHCKNCIYSNFEPGLYNTLNSIHCFVKYEVIQNYNQRTRALFCRHYKQRNDNSSTE